ncbi:MAG: LPS export ABC transporter periplasmic protein LptC [Pseudomonadota bacterium]
MNAGQMNLNTPDLRTPAARASSVAVSNVTRMPSPPRASAGPTAPESAFRAAKRHSLIVAVMKRGLPAIALLTVAFFLFSAVSFFFRDVEVSLAGVGIEDGKLVMNAPKMAGFDKENRAYDVSASRAMQDITKPTLVELEQIDASIPMDANGNADIKAAYGLYDTESENLQLRDDIVITGARGMDIRLQRASIDMRTGDLSSDMPVEVTSQDADIRADSVTVENNGERIIFRNAVKMTIRRPIERGKPVAANAPANQNNGASAEQDNANNE